MVWDERDRTQVQKWTSAVCKSVPSPRPFIFLQLDVFPSGCRVLTDENSLPVGCEVTHVNSLISASGTVYIWKSDTQLAPELSL